jgi:hypothetical protein
MFSNNKGAGYGCSTHARNVFSLRSLIFLFNKGNQHVKPFFLIPGIPSLPGFFSGRNRCFSGQRSTGIIFGDYTITTRINQSA